MRRKILRAAVSERMPPMVWETKYYVCQCFRLWSNPRKGTNFVKCMECQSMCPKAFEAKEIKIGYHCQDCGHKWKCRELIWGEKWCKNCGNAGIPNKDFWDELYYPTFDVVKLIRDKLANKGGMDWVYFYRTAIDKLYNTFIDL